MAHYLAIKRNKVLLYATIGESQMLYVKGKKPDWKGYIRYRK